MINLAQLVSPSVALPPELVLNKISMKKTLTGFATVSFKN